MDINDTYINLLKDIIKNGKILDNKKSIFGKIIKYDINNGFPILSNDIKFNMVKTELLWVLSNKMTLSYLIKNDFSLLNKYLYDRYLDSVKFDSSGNWCKHKINDETKTNYPEPFNYPEFIHKIKTDIDFDEKWCNSNEIIKELYNNDSDFYQNKKIFIKLINDIRDFTDNIYDVKLQSFGNMNFQLKLNLISFKDRLLLLNDKCNDITNIKIDDNKFNEYNIPKYNISLMWYQKTIDVINELPFNISSYGLLLILISKFTNTIPYELISNLGDIFMVDIDKYKIEYIIGKDMTLNDRIKYYKDNVVDNENINDLSKDKIKWILDEYDIPKHTNDIFRKNHKIILSDNIDWSDYVNPIIVSLNLNDINLL